MTRKHPLIDHPCSALVEMALGLIVALAIGWAMIGAPI